jgi:hypothetical protein
MFGTFKIAAPPSPPFQSALHGALNWCALPTYHETDSSNIPQTGETAAEEQGLLVAGAGRIKINSAPSE